MNEPLPVLPVGTHVHFRGMVGIPPLDGVVVTLAPSYSPATEGRVMLKVAEGDPYPHTFVTVPVRLCRVEEE